MKFYRFQCSNKQRFDIPLSVIVRDKAEYALEKNWFELEDIPEENRLGVCYQKIEAEFEQDHSEIEDWARNNMNWSDVVEYAKVVPTNDIEPDMQSEWCDPIDVEIIRQN